MAFVDGYHCHTAFTHWIRVGDAMIFNERLRKLMHQKLAYRIRSGMLRMLKRCFRQRTTSTAGSHRALRGPSSTRRTNGGLEQMQRSRALNSLCHIQSVLLALASSMPACLQPHDVDFAVQMAPIFAVSSQVVHSLLHFCMRMDLRVAWN